MKKIVKVQYLAHITKIDKLIPDLLTDHFGEDCGRRHSRGERHGHAVPRATKTK